MSYPKTFQSDLKRNQELTKNSGLWEPVATLWWILITFNYVVIQSLYLISYPGLAGDIHFDDDDLFTEDGSVGVSLPWITLHEIGHSLGLFHSEVSDSIMNPFYFITKTGPDLDLRPDDIAGIQSLYGKLNYWTFHLKVTCIICIREKVALILGNFELLKSWLLNLSIFNVQPRFFLCLC